MEPTLLAAIVTVVGPLVVAVLKKVLKTDETTEAVKPALNTMLPLAVGLLAGIVNCVAASCGGEAEACGKVAEWGSCIMAGLAGGAGSSYVRDFDKNVLGLAKGASTIIGKRQSGA